MGNAVPITAQSMGVMLAGRDPRAPGAASSSVALLLVLVAVGLPLLAGGRGGLGVFASPSVGFLLGWPVAAYVVGWLTERGGPSYRLGWGIAANVVGGIVVLYAFGIVGMVVVLDIGVWQAVVLERLVPRPATWSRRCSRRSSRAACTRPTRAARREPAAR